MTVAALALLLLSQADAGAPPLEAPEIAEARASLELMRNLLRAVEHGMQEATDLGDRAAFDCVKSGHLAISSRVDSAEQWNQMLPDTVAAQDPEQLARLLRHIADAQRDVVKRASDLASCKLSVATPPTPALNRSWFGCSGEPPTSEGIAWRGCEQRWTSAVTFGLEGLLLAAPLASLIAVSRRDGALEGFPGLMLESSAGGLIGGLALFAASGAVALAITAGMSDARAGRVWPFVGVLTALGTAAGALTWMSLARPNAGLAAPISAAAGFLLTSAISAVLMVVYDHFGFATGANEPTLAEKSFGVAPVLMAVSSMVVMPAAWSLFTR